MSDTVQDIVENNDPAFPVVDEGFDIQEVQKFVTEAQNLVGRLLKDNAELRNEIKRANPHQAIAAESATLLVHAQQVADEYVAEAKAEAGQTIADADEYSANTRREADETAAGIVEDANNRVAQLREEIETLQTTRNEMIKRALAFYEQETARLNEYADGE